MIWGALVGGLVGTVVLTTVLRAAGELGLTRMDLPLLLGTAVTDDRRRASAIGYALHFCFGLLFALLYRHAYRRREALGLDAMETLLTRHHMTGHLLTASIGVLSLAIVAAFGSRAAGYAGWSYGLIGPTQAVYWRKMSRQRQRLADELAKAG